jgi:hypothetical protein
LEAVGRIWRWVRYLCDAVLHDEEAGVVDVELYGLEEGFDGLLLWLVAVEYFETFGGATCEMHCLEGEKKMEVNA